MAAALDAGIGQFNVESEPELRVLSEVAASRGDARADRDPHQPRRRRRHARQDHDRPQATDKFGIDIARAGRHLRLARALPGIEVVGVAVHIGSQIVDMAPFRAAFARVAELAGAASWARIKRLDLGGGLGVAYRRRDAAADPSEYARAVREATAGLGR